MLVRNSAGKLSADPTKTSWKNELTNPVALAAAVGFVFSWVAFALAFFHVGPHATLLVEHIRSLVVLWTPFAAVLFAAIFTMGHITIKKLEVALVALDKEAHVIDPAVPVVNVPQV